MKLTAALIQEQGQTFVVLLVNERVLSIPVTSERDEALAFAERQFGVPAALLGDADGRTYGDSNIVAWLGGIAFEQLPWKEYEFTP